MKGLAAALVVVVLAGVVAARQTNERANLIGLDPQTVEARIGPPTSRADLADSDESYWTYRTKVGVLIVHFQNSQVVDIDPADFPVGKILK